MSASASILRWFARDEVLRLRVSGQCMAPHLPDGAIVEVRASRWYWPGDVIAYETARGQLLVHRVIGYRPGAGGLQLMTQADAGDVPDAPVPISSVIGKTSGVAPVTRARAAGRFLRLAARRLRERLC